MICDQFGVFRVNCIDCLDRTNIVQSAIAKVILETQVNGHGGLLQDCGSNFSALAMVLLLSCAKLSIWSYTETEKCKICLCYSFNHISVELFRENLQLYLIFLPFLEINVVQAVETLPGGRKIPALSQKVNTMAADDLVMQRARSSAIQLLALFFLNILVSAPECVNEDRWQSNRANYILHFDGQA